MRPNMDIFSRCLDDSFVTRFENLWKSLVLHSLLAMRDDSSSGRQDQDQGAAGDEISVGVPATKNRLCGVRR